MRVIIAGGRDFLDYRRIEGHVWNLYDKYTNLKIISGGANGADKLGEVAAKTCGVPAERFPAQWDKYGKRAGYMRNEEMANNADMLLAFWDGESKGTKHMIDIALKKDLEVHVYRYKNE